ncbi:MAG: hypothetical protein GY711_08800 [bacterium]|nr:hypothetical protein [bacterium]
MQVTPVPHVLVTLFALLAQACNPPPAQDPGRQVSEEPADGSTRVVVELHPLDAPVATAVYIGADGALQHVRFAPASGAIVDVRDAQLTPERLRALRASLADAEQLAAPSVGEAGVEYEGDVFALHVLGPDRVRNAGVVDVAAPSVRAFIARWTAEPTAGTPRTGEHFARAAPIEAERFRALRTAGRLVFHAKEDLADVPRAVVGEALAVPWRFVAVETGAHAALAAMADGGVYVDDDGRGYEITLWVREDRPR